MREPGYYWVYNCLGKYIGLWDEKGWTVPGYYPDLPDDSFTVFSEKLEPPDET